MDGEQKPKTDGEREQYFLNQVTATLVVARKLTLWAAAGPWTPANGCTNRGRPTTSLRSFLFLARLPV